jgi:hypothetical protein
MERITSDSVLIILNSRLFQRRLYA